MMAHTVRGPQRARHIVRRQERTDAQARKVTYLSRLDIMGRNRRVSGVFNVSPAPASSTLYFLSQTGGAS